MATGTRPIRPMLAAPALIIAALAAGPAFAQSAPPAPPPAKVGTMSAEQRLMAPQIEIPGTVLSRQDSEVAAEVAGRVVWIAEVGTRVEAGDPIAKLDDRELRLRARELEAQVASLQSQLEFQTREVARLERLAAGNNTTVSRLEESTSRRDTLAQDLVRTRAQHERLKLDLERATVTAPFAGQVASRMMEVGEYSAPGREVARLVAVDDVEVRAQAPVAMAGQIAEGMKVHLAGAHGDVEATIARIVPVGDERSRTFELRVAVPEGAWIVGAPVRVALPSAAPRQVTAVHRDALVLRGNGTFIMRVNAESKAERLPVTTGVALGDWIEVLGDVKPGDKVVIRGAERLREGQAVDLDPKVS